MARLSGSGVGSLLVGLGLPGWIAAPAVWLVMRRANQRLQEAKAAIERRHSTAPANQVNEPTQSVGAPAPAPMQPASTPSPIVVRQQSPPPPQVVERERSFIEVQVPTHRLAAIEWAMDELVRRAPGARPTIETIEAYAAQYASGLKKN